MIWPFRRHGEPEGEPVEDSQGLVEAQEALEQALSQWADVTLVTEQIRGIRRRNHLAELAHDAMGAHRR